MWLHRIGVTRGTIGAMPPKKFLAYLVVLCFDLETVSQTKYCCSLKVKNIWTLQKFRAGCATAYRHCCFVREMPASVEWNSSYRPHFLHVEQRKNRENVAVSLEWVELMDLDSWREKADPLWHSFPIGVICRLSSLLVIFAFIWSPTTIGTTGKSIFLKMHIALRRNKQRENTEIDQCNRYVLALHSLLLSNVKSGQLQPLQLL